MTHAAAISPAQNSETFGESPRQFRHNEVSIGNGKVPMQIWEYTEDVNNYAHLLFVDQGFTRRLVSEFMGKSYTGQWNVPEDAYAREWEAPGLGAEEREILRKLNEDLPQPDLPLAGRC